MITNFDALKRLFLCPLGFHGRPVGGVDILKYECNYNKGRMLRYRAFAKCARCERQVTGTPVPEILSPPRDAPMAAPTVSYIQHPFIGRMGQPCEICGQLWGSAIHTE